VATPRSELLGVNGSYALFGTGDPDGLTVVVSLSGLDTFDPQPYVSVDLTRWDEPDPSVVPTEAWELAATAIAAGTQVEGTDVIIASGKKDKRSFSVPKAVKEEAKRGLKWHADNKRGGTDVGMNTARKLSSGQPVSIETVRHVARYFPRHEPDKKGKGWSQGDAGYPSNGRIAWALWGGDAGRTWAEAIVKRDASLSVIGEMQAIVAAEAAALEAEAPAELAENDIDIFEEHSFASSDEIDGNCSVCGATYDALIHVTPENGSLDANEPDPDAENAPAAAAEPEPVVASAEFDLEKFHRIHELAPDFEMFAEVIYDESTDTPDVITNLFAQLPGGDWQQWDRTQSDWVDVAEPADDIVIIDLASAMAAATLLAERSDTYVPIEDLDLASFAVFSEAISTLDIIEPAATEDVRFFLTLGEDGDVDHVLLVAADGSHWVWDGGGIEWLQLDEKVEEGVPCDAEQARDIALRQSGAVALAERAVDIHFDLGFSRANWLASDLARSLVAAGGEYTPEERSKNASSQFRDAMGRFAKSGDVVEEQNSKRSATVVGYDKASDTVQVRYGDGTQQSVSPKMLKRLGSAGQEGGGTAPTGEKRIDVSGVRGEPRAVAGVTPKAMLPKMLQPMDKAALDKVVTDYQAFIESERRRKLESYANLTPETSDVKPLYLAQVDELDNAAVVDLIALVPKTDKTSDLQSFVRRNGRWEADPKMLAAIKSTIPPPLTVLDEQTMEQVKEQVDSYYRSKAAKQASAWLPTLWTEDGTLLPASFAMMTDAATITAAGIPGIADTPGDVAAARRLKRYWLVGPGAAKIRWNTPGDWTRCFRHLAKYMGVRARGYCQNLHKEATGVYTGSRFNVGKKRGLRADGSVLLASTATRVLSSPAELEALNVTSLDALVEIDLPSVDDLKNLSTREAGHRLRVGERFLAQGSDGTYVVTVLDPRDTLGWAGEPMIVVNDGERARLLRESA
jgi:hypothetical protein